MGARGPLDATKQWTWRTEPARRRSVFLGRDPFYAGNYQPVSLAFPRILFGYRSVPGYSWKPHPESPAQPFVIDLQAVYAVEDGPVTPKTRAWAFPLTYWDPHHHPASVHNRSHVGYGGVVCLDADAQLKIARGMPPGEVFWLSGFYYYDGEMLREWERTGVAPVRGEKTLAEYVSSLGPYVTDSDAPWD